MHSTTTLPLRGEFADPLGERRTQRIVWAFLILGVVARTVRYALRFPLWADECFLAANLLDRGYLDLLQGLNFGQVCPFGVLWIQLTVTKLFGFNEYALRLVPFLLGLGSLVLFRRLTSRLLQGPALILAFGCFAVSYPGIRYAAEAKQYAFDLFFGILLTTLAVEWRYRDRDRRFLWALTAAVFPAMMLSYPTAFVGGGVSLFLAWNLRRSRDRRDGIAWIAFNVVLLASFGLLFLFSAANQSDNMLSFMQSCWADGFPPLNDPLQLAQWLLSAHTGAMMAYPAGGNHGASTLTFLAFLVGLLVLIRRRQFGLILLLLAPLGLNLIAAAMHRYPYGQMVKFQIGSASAICITAGLGFAALLQRLGGRSPMSQAGGDPAASPASERSPHRQWLVVGVVLLALVGLASIARDFCFPAKTAAVQRARDFARWFWFTTDYDGKIVCLQTDFRKTFSPHTFQWGLSAVYLCNQRIYSPRHAAGHTLSPEQMPADRPFRCVEYRGTAYPYDQPAHDAWLAEMTQRFDLASDDEYPFVLADRKDMPPGELDYLRVYKFVPKGERSQQTAASRHDPARRK